MTVVVGCYQGEALADELALIDGQVRELRRGDATPRNQRVPPDEGHRGDRVAMPTPGADHLLAQIQLPAGVSHRRLFGEVEVTGELARLCRLARGKESHVPEELIVVCGRGGRRDIGAPVPRAVGIPDDPLRLAKLGPAAVERGEGALELLVQALLPAPVGQRFLRRLGGKARHDAFLRRHHLSLAAGLGRRCAGSRSH